MGVAVVAIVWRSAFQRVLCFALSFSLSHSLAFSRSSLAGRRVQSTVTSSRACQFPRQKPRRLAWDVQEQRCCARIDSCAAMHASWPSRWAPKRERGRRRRNEALALHPSGSAKKPPRALGWCRHACPTWLLRQRRQNFHTISTGQSRPSEGEQLAVACYLACLPIPRPPSRCSAAHSRRLPHGVVRPSVCSVLHAAGCCRLSRARSAPLGRCWGGARRHGKPLQKNPPPTPRMQMRHRPPP